MTWSTFADLLGAATSHPEHEQITFVWGELANDPRLRVRANAFRARTVSSHAADIAWNAHVEATRRIAPRVLEGQAWRSFGFAPEQVYSSYLHRTWLEQVRALRRETDRLEYSAEPAEPAIDQREHREPWEGLWRAEVRGLLAHLPARERAVVLLRVVEDLPHRDIALVLGITECHAQQLLSRALRKLRSLEQARMLGPAAEPLSDIRRLAA